MRGNNGFSVVVEKNALLGSTEMEGPAAIGGDLQFGQGYNVAIHTPGGWTAPGDSAPTSLLVGGRVDFGSSSTSGVLRVVAGHVKVGDTAGTSVLTEDRNGASVNTHVVRAGSDYDSTPRIELTTRQPAASVGPQPGLMDFTSLFAGYRDRAQAIAACANNVELNNGRITLAPNRTNVLHVTGEQLNELDELTFLNRPTRSGPLAIVVDTTATGGALTWGVPNMAGVSGQDAPYILWDFPDATDITLATGDSLEGTVYAPRARFTDLDPANIEGDIAVKELVAGPLTGPGGTAVNAGEIHHFPFDATLDCTTPTPPSRPTGSIRINKTDASNGAPLAGAVFDLWRETNSVPGLQTSGASPDTRVQNPCTTDGAGRCGWRALELGSYYVRETAAPDGYRLPANPVNGPVEVTRQNADTGVSLTRDNTPDTAPPQPRGALHLRKSDAKTGRPLAGAVFELWRETNRAPGLQPAGKNADTLTGPGCATDARGRCDFAGLPLGRYYLRETDVPEGYKLPARPVTGPYRITASHASQGITVRLKNTRGETPKGK
ncbi:collagen-binding domain-containing protein [Streptomyces sp. NPDC050085]|uniref:collagen-binding domain-containing protein n=1 Tax=Streptomyces sp. NPDC050085 TaxID=3365600 RepID=UPI0037B25EF6